ncbi:MAG TPA: alpha/beta family hydrolase [Micromonosporaceae bacterium]|nr:alpha/beta family hydrolase [Micromonosporaceae bacterium]
MDASPAGRRLEIDTRWGRAAVDLDIPPGVPASLLVLGHGAGGDVDAPDLVAVRDLALTAGVVVARMTQPYRVAGRRSPAPAGHLDGAFAAVVEAVVEQAPAPALVVGGRSSGARVACRTAGGLGAAGVVALAFPLHPPRRRGEAARSGADEAADRSRAGELATGRPTLVVNGDRDPFGVPVPSANVRVVVRPGERHDLRRDPDGVAAVVVDWMRSGGWAR